MRDWNLVATIRDGMYRRARAALDEFCPTDRTEYYNVLIGSSGDPSGVLNLLSAYPDASEMFSRVVPLTTTFSFQTAHDLDEQALAAVAELAPELEGKSFHVRMHRRGFKGRVRTLDEERLLSEAVLRITTARGAPARVSFDDPDAIVVVETVDNRGGMALFTREDRMRWPLLHID